MNELKFKVGDIVKAVDNDKYAWTTKSNKWIGRVTRVDESSFCAKTLEMKNDRWVGYVFTGLAYEYFEKDDRMLHPVIEKHLIKGNKTIIKLSNGKVGIAECNPEDKFDEAIGAAIATLRAYGENVEDFAKEFTDCEHKEKPKTRKPFSVGQLVQIKDWGEMEREYGLDRSGYILCNPCFTKGMEPLCGEFAEIIDIEGTRIWLKLFNFDVDKDWCYSTDMIKPIKKGELK